MRPIHFGSPKEAARSLEGMAKDVRKEKLVIISIDIKTNNRHERGMFEDQSVVVTGPKQIQINLMEIIHLTKLKKRKKKNG